MQAQIYMDYADFADYFSGKDKITDLARMEGLHG
jgi:hypothetical protein